MPQKIPLNPGDLVFAKVKGFPAWPARVQGKQSNGKFAIFFYGTFETASLKRNEIWPYDEEHKAKFCVPSVIKRKGYPEGLDQIENSPEIAPILSDLETEIAPPTKIKQNSAPVVLKKPVKMLDGTPIKPPINSNTGSAKRGIKREAGTEEGEDKAAKRPHLESSPEASSPSTTSRSGRIIRPKKFVDDLNSSTDLTEEAKVADRIIEEPRKVWVKLVASGDLVEINLDKDKPARWDNNQQKVMWEQATARNALKFKQQVEGGMFIPEEVRKKLEEKTVLSPEEEQVLKRAATLSKRKKKLSWLKVEQQMVDTDIAIKTSLSATNPQISRCVNHINSLLALPLEPLMMKKQPDLVMTMRRLMKYQGPLDLSGYNKEERADIARGVKQVKERSTAVFSRLSHIFKNFDPSGSETFTDFFQTQVDNFKEKTKDWDLDKVLGMTEEDEVEPVSES